MKKLIESSSNYIPVQFFPNNLNEEDKDSVIDEICNDKNFRKSHTEIETYESIGELQFPQRYDDGCINILGELNEKKTNDPRVQAMFKQSRHKNISIFIFSQDYYELPKKTVRANENNYHIFKPNSFREVEKLYQDKASMDMTFTEFKYLTSTSCDKKDETLAIDMTKGMYSGCY